MRGTAISLLSAPRRRSRSTTPAVATACAIGIGGLGEFPVRLDHAAEALIGTDLDDAAIADAVDAAMANLDIWGDLHASADYRRRTGGVLARRALSDARQAAIGEAAMKVELSINGETRSADVEPRKTLLDCLRDDFGLTGSHTGCEHGVCGACTVLLDGEPARSCLMFAVQADGYEITTIEGIAPAPGELSVIQDAFCEMHGLQCGYCTPGMVLTATALLRDNPQPTRARDRRSDFRQYLPLHRLRPDRRSDCACRRAAGARQSRRKRSKR